MTSWSPAQLLGRQQDHLVPLNERHWLHRDVYAPWQALQDAARADGIDLQLASSFRSFERQQAIWNGKCRGERPLRNRANQLVSIESLTEQGILEAVLAWSALPGASRHHWGTDLDVYAPAMLAGQPLQLEPWEYQAGGPMAALGDWLDARLGTFGFFRPYRQDRGGVAIEPWHISHIETATPAMHQLTPALLEQALQHADLALKTVVLSQLEEIYQQFVVNIDSYD